MITAFQSNAFQTNAFQIESTLVKPILNISGVIKNYVLLSGLSDVEKLVFGQSLNVKNLTGYIEDF
jgi:hypothetical protein